MNSPRGVSLALFPLNAVLEPSGLARARIEMIPADADASVPQDYAACARLLKSAFDRLPSPPPAAAVHFDSCAWVSARLAELLPLPLAAKQKLLEETDGRARLARVNAILMEAGLLRESS